MKTYENKVTGATIEVSDDVIVEGENWQPVQPAEKGKKGGKKGGKKDSGQDPNQDSDEDDQD